MKHRAAFLKALFIIVLFLSCFIFVYGRYTRQQVQTATDQHAQIVALPFWNYDLDSTKTYLETVAHFYDYQEINIFDQNSQLRMHQAHDEHGTLDHMLTLLHLIPHEQFSSVISYEGKTLGRIQVSWRNKNIYIYSYAFGIGMFLMLLLHLFRDNTRRKAREEVLQENADLLHATQNSTTDGILVVDAQGKVLTVNDRFIEMWGFPPGMVVPGTEDHELINFIENQLSDPASFRETVESLYKSSTEQLDELRFKDGKIYERYSCPLIHNQAEVGRVWNFRDISQRKATEEALKKSDLLYREAQAIAHLGHWELDLITNALAWSDEVFRIFEIDKTKFGTSYEAFLQAIHPEDRSLVELAYRFSVSSKKAYNITHRLLMPDGRIKFVQEQGRTYYDPSGTPIRSLGTIQDLTSQKETEQALLTEKFFTTALINSLPGIFYVYDLENLELVRWNNNHEVLTGYEAEELQRIKPEDLLLDEDKEKIRQGIREVQELGEMNFEAHLRRKNGTSLPYLFSGKLLRQDEKRYLIGLAIDISQRKKMEEALLITQHAVDKSAMPVLWVELDPHRVIYANEAASTLLGYSREEFLAAPKGFLHPSGSTEYWDDNLLALKQQKSRTGEVPLRKKDGSLFQAAISATILEYGQRQLALLYIQDQSQKLLLEQELRQAQKMEAIGTLAGGIAHDFNNILAAVLGYSQILQQSLPADSDERASVDQIYNAGLRAKELVKQILTFSRKSEQDRIPLRMQLVVKEALKLLRASIPTTIEIKQNIDNECGTVLADPTQIHQIIMNLCTNAYHAMRDTGGILSVSLQEVVLQETELTDKMNLHPGKHVRLTVSDNGRGMTQETITRIFEPYFTTKEQGEGTGLGLAVVHGIVKSCEGEITVSSELGKGTTFAVYLAVVQENKPAQTSAFALNLPTGSERVLIVDDEKNLAEMMRRMLENLGYQARDFASSEEALAFFRQAPHDWDLVVSDMTMPQLNGAQLSSELLSIRPDLPIIICTGFSELINEEKAKELGIKALITKPILTRNLAESVRKVLDSKK